MTLHTHRTTWLGMAAAVLAAFSTSAGQTHLAAQSAGVSDTLQQDLLESLERGNTYLIGRQHADGTWEDHPGITALAVSAILGRTGTSVEDQRPQVAGALAHLTSLAKPNGGIYERDVPHYITAVALAALVASEEPRYQEVIEKARAYLVGSVVDEGEGYTRSDKFYGGLGYGSDLRPDLSNLEHGLRALKEAALPADDPIWEKALTFLQRTQNLADANDQGWASNDGGFVYYPGFTYAEGGGTQSYGSMTYAGLISYSYASVEKDDLRVQAALRWIRNNYTVDENPGLGDTTLYYYYLVFAKALAAYGEDVIVDGNGDSHNWRAELGGKLLELQHDDGHWVNTNPEYMQDNPVLVTAFTMMAIEQLLENQ